MLTAAILENQKEGHEYLSLWLTTLLLKQLYTMTAYVAPSMHIGLDRVYIGNRHIHAPKGAYILKQTMEKNRRERRPWTNAVTHKKLGSIWECGFKQKAKDHTGKMIFEDALRHKRETLHVPGDSSMCRKQQMSSKEQQAK